MTRCCAGECPDRYLYDHDGARYRITTATRLVIGPMPFAGCAHTATTDDGDDPNDLPEQGSLWEVQ